MKWLLPGKLVDVVLYKVWSCTFCFRLVILKQGSSHLERYKIVSSSTFDISKFLIHKKFHKYWMTVASFTLWSLLRSSAMASVSLNCFTRSPCSWAAASRGPSTVLLNKEKQGANADKKYIIFNQIQLPKPSLHSHCGYHWKTGAWAYI